MKEQSNTEAHTEIIKCPECEKVQWATVEHTWPWWSYIHICNHCEYVIMESEWEKVGNKIHPTQNNQP